MFKRFVAFLLMVLILAPLPAGAIKYKGDLESNESVIFPEQGSTPANPAAPKHKLYFDDGGAAYTLDSSGNVTALTRGGFKNRMNNGNFDLWQRGTSFTGLSSASVYTADRWEIITGAAGTIDVTRQDFTEGQTDVPGNPKYFMRVDITSSGSGSTEIKSPAEDVDWGAGLPVTVSFWAKGSVARTLTMRFWQVFGTGGSSQVITTVGSAAVTTTWQKFTIYFTVPSISSKTIGTAHTHYVLLNAYWGHSVTGSVDLARFQMELGGAATVFEERPIAAELALAQRYYFKTFPQGTAPAQNAGRNGAVQITAQGTSSSHSHFSLPVTMRTEPTITFYNPSATNAQIRNHNLSTDFTATSSNSETSHGMIAFLGTPPASSSVTHACSVHITADAEF